MKKSVLIMTALLALSSPTMAAEEVAAGAGSSTGAAAGAGAAGSAAVGGITAGALAVGVAAAAAIGVAVAVASNNNDDNPSTVTSTAR
ncbi:hypothetical protein ACO2CR_19010 [Aeromonas caviae]|nr:hypothetical protein C2U37_11790 [Aeromonas sp. ASNIH1]